MNSNTKAILISILLFVIFFVVTFFTFKIVFNFSEGPFLGMISAVIAAIFSPKRKIITMQSGTEVQLVWFFCKKVLRIK